jgi:hypothetical protein
MFANLQKWLSSLPNPQAAALVLRLGLAFVFAYAAIDSLLHPNDWVGYMPRVATDIISTYGLLKILAVYQLFLVGWLLVGKYARYAGLLSALTLAGITVVNLGVFGITFRDVGLLMAALALAFIAKD